VQVLTANLLFISMLAVFGPEGDFGSLRWICELGRRNKSTEHSVYKVSGAPTPAATV
jgi:hypothetical protein